MLRNFKWPQNTRKRLSVISVSSVVNTRLRHDLLFGNCYIVLNFILCVLCVFAVSGKLYAAEIPKIVVLAFDGADMNLTKQWIDEGHLPNLDRLQKTGCFKPLVPPYPPQTPVSWASFATGKNPGKTTIFDFLKRDPKTYMPDFAMNSVSQQQVLWGKWTSVIIAPSVGAVLFLIIFLAFLSRNVQG